jgi:hypothetical protein
MYDDKKTTIYRIVVVILIIIILLLVFFNRNKVGEINNNPIPTGNIDFFDIDVHAEYGLEEMFPENLPNTYGNETATTKKVKKLYSINGQNTVDINTYNPTTDKEKLGKVFVDDKNGDYLYQQNLAIFENSAFEYETKIALFDNKNKRSTGAFVGFDLICLSSAAWVPVECRLGAG